MGSEEDVEIIVDTETLALCRLCIQHKGKLQMGKQMRNNLKECFDITVNTYDGMSQIICEICKKLVCEIVEVREKFRKNQQILIEKRKQLLNQNESKRSVSPISIESDGDNKHPKLSRVSENNNDVKNIKQSKRLITPDKNIKKGTMSTYELFKNSTNSPKVDDNKATTVSISPAESAKRNRNPVTKSLASSSTILVDSESGSSQENKIKSKKKIIFNNKNTDSDDSEEDDIAVSRKRHTISFHCRVCNKIFYKKNRVKDHIVTSHQHIYNQVQEICKPSSVSLRQVPFSLERDSDDASNEQTCDGWVRLSRKKILKFSPRHQLFYMCKSLRKENILLSSSDEEDNEKLITYKRILAKPPKSHIKRKNSSEIISTLFGEDSDVENNAPEKLKIRTTSVDHQNKRRVSSSSKEKEPSREPSEDWNSDVESLSGTSLGEASNDGGKSSAASKSGSIFDKSKLVMSEDEIARVIENCYKTAKIKKSLTAPIKKDWLVKDVTNMSSLNVVWMNAPTVKVSRISSTLKQDSGDVVSKLPVYGKDKNTTANASAHLKLLRPAEKSPPKQDTQAPKGSVKVLGKNQVLVRKPVVRESSQSDIQTVVHDMPSLQPIDTLKSKPSAVKRTSAVIQESVAKKPCTETMNPIIVSTVSLAKNIPSTENDISFTPTSTETRPLIKCKPTSLLMPSPVKPTTTTTSTIPDDNIVVLGEQSTNPQPPPQSVVTVNNQNTIMFNGYNLEINNHVNNINYTTTTTINQNDILKTNNGPQLLNNLVSAPTVTPALLSANSIVPTAASYSDPMNFYSSAPVMQSDYVTLNNLPYNNANMVTQYASLQQNSYLQDTNTNNEFIDINSQYPAMDNLQVRRMPPTTLSRLQGYLKKNNIILATCLSTPTKYSKLLRFVLTIKEKNMESPLMISSEFIVEVCLQTDGYLVLNVSDNVSTIDVKNWTIEFQNELITALKKTDFLNAMRKVSDNLSYGRNVTIFADILEKFVVTS